MRRSQYNSRFQRAKEHLLTQHVLCEAENKKVAVSIVCCEEGCTVQHCNLLGEHVGLATGRLVRLKATVHFHQ